MSIVSSIVDVKHDLVIFRLNLCASHQRNNGTHFKRLPFGIKYKTYNHKQRQILSIKV